MPDLTWTHHSPHPVMLVVIWQSVLETNPYEPPRDSCEVATPSTVEPWPDRQRTLFLLAAVPALFLPVSYVVIVATGISSGAPVHSVPVSLIGFLGLFGTAIQLPVYLLWVIISGELSLKQKLIWGSVLLLINMFGIPLFLYAKYRRQTVTMMSARHTSASRTDDRFSSQS